MRGVKYSVGPCASNSPFYGTGQGVINYNINLMVQAGATCFHFDGIAIELIRNLIWWL